MDLVAEVAGAFADVDAEAWDAVVEATGAPVFYSAGYLRAYERDPLGQVDGVAYLTLRERGAAVAVAPLYLQHRADPLGHLRGAYPEAAGESALLSHVWHCYDGQVLSRQGPAAVLPAVLDAVRDAAHRLGARWYGLVNLDRAGPTAAAVRALGLPLRHLVDRYGADLTGLADLEDYLARLGPRARANLRRGARRAAESGVSTAVRPVAEVDLAEIAELCDRTAGRFGNAGFYPAGRFERFVTALAPAAEVIEIRQAGRLVAVGVCLVDERRFHTWTCGVDYAVDGNFSPYALLFAESVATALRLRRPVLEGGRSNATFKERHGLAARHLDALLIPA
jgi:predicted N-acyltransferase